MIGSSRRGLWGFCILLIALIVQSPDSLAQNQSLAKKIDSQKDYLNGVVLHRQLKFDSAVAYYRRCLAEINKKVPADTMRRREVEKRIYECESGKDLVGAPRKFLVSNLGAQINSPFEDYAPVLTEDENLLVFTSRKPNGNLNPQKANDGKFFEDIFYSRKQNGNWSSSRNIGRPINTSFHDSDLALSADGRQLFLYSDQREGDILVSEFVNGKWNQPQTLPSPINTKYHESSVSVSADGTKMFLASERPGGLGGSDIYLIEKQPSGQWSAAMNLGPVVNTPWNEENPFIDYDGGALYFSSTGHNSMGGFDIFRSELKEGKWSVAENLGYPINTPEHESHFVSTPDGKRAYYSSVRAGGFGEEDIYLITLPNELMREEKLNVTVESRPESVASQKEAEQAIWVIYFPLGSSHLADADLQRLDAVAEVVRKEATLIQIEGHTDNSGTERFNQGLSVTRSSAVQSYLESKGIPADRIRATGLGAGRPAVSNEHEKSGRELNRRVEIRVIQK